MKSKKFWDKMADRYDDSVKKKYAEAYRRTIEITRQYLKPVDCVLEVGCGTGIVTEGIASDVASVLAIDPSEKMIANLQKKIAASNITNITGKIADLNDPDVLSGRYNVVTAFNVLYFLEDIEAQLQKIHSMLPENGYFLSVTDCFGGKNKLKNVVIKVLVKLGIIPFMQAYSPDQLIMTVEKAGFKIIQTEILFTDPPNLYIVTQK